MAKELHITVSDELASSIDRVVSTGKFASRDAVISAALDQWIENDFPEPDVTILRRLWDEGIASGPSEEDAAEFFARMKRKYSALS